MNSSTLRRLASDHASLHKAELPPHYLFPANTSSIPDDLTQLTILLTGPLGTPYSQGLWKLCLKIPEDYPKSPPKAAFRTRIWHPNVEETTGSVCVDTLKRDWDPKLTLRDVLITISCLLIQPNPDSALNAAAGHLLQDDYETFARQARLMTSIHATVPPNLKDAVLAAKRRGEAPGTTIKEETDQRPSMKPKTSSSSVVMKRRPNIALRSIARSENHLTVTNKSMDEDLEDEASESKENDPSQSPSLVIAPSPRRPSLPKRPLSDLPTPTDPDFDDDDPSGLSPSERNIVNNTPHFSSPFAPTTEYSRQTLKLAERSRCVTFTSRGLQDVGGIGLAIVSFDIKEDETEDTPVAKRQCSWEGKENIMERSEVEKPTLPAIRSAPVLGALGGASSFAGAPKLSSVPSTSGKSTRPKIGLRRL